MSTSTINGQELYELWLGAYRNLRQHEQYIDQLNVFPVPDGDTGANMAMTLSGGVSVGGEKESVAELMAAFSRGTLFSARGNSGVILSQFVRGMAKGAEGKDTLTPTDFAVAVRSGVDYAYKAVVRPVEGTVLTVMRETADFLEAHADEFSDVETIFIALDTLRDYDYMGIYNKDMSGIVRNDPEVCRLMREAGNIAGLENLPYRTITIGASDAAAVSRSKNAIKAAAFAAMDPAPARYYHTRLDTHENLDLKTIEAGVGLCIETAFLYDEKGLNV